MNPFRALKVRLAQGRQFVPDLRAAVPAGYRGRPRIPDTPCEAGCTRCRDACPSRALGAPGEPMEPVTLDLGRCVTCGLCEEVCPIAKITFPPDTATASRTRAGLRVVQGAAPVPIAPDPDLSRVFGRSLRLRQVSAGGCNGCELELGALTNVNFDVQRYGIDWVASPRHADGLVLTGPITRHMARALALSWDAMPDPRFVVAFGACAISGGPYADSPELDRSFLDRVGPVLHVPGCPPHPLTLARALLDLLGR